MRMSLRPLAAAAVATGVVALSSSVAMAAAPTGDYVNFRGCPYTNPAVGQCIYSNTTSGSFRLGNASVPINRSIVFQGGFTLDQTTFRTTVYPGPLETLSRTGLDVPGGLLGIMDPGGFGRVLYDLFIAATRSFNGVTATAELVGLPQFDFIQFLVGGSPSVVLPLRIKLDNPFLGSNCYIGSAGSPVTLRLTTGTTTPPRGVTPLRGSPGTLQSNQDGTVNTATGVSLVDNTFSVPAATDCGSTFLDKPLVTLAVNLKEGLPAAAGVSSAVLNGTSQVGDRVAVAASVR